MRKPQPQFKNGFAKHTFGDGTSLLIKSYDQIVEIELGVTNLFLTPHEASALLSILNGLHNKPKKFGFLHRWTR